MTNQYVTGRYADGQTQTRLVITTNYRIGNYASR